MTITAGPTPPDHASVMVDLPSRMTSATKSIDATALRGNADQAARGQP